jgi:hypothetical protein
MSVAIKSEAAPVISPAPGDLSAEPVTPFVLPFKAPTTFLGTVEDLYVEGRKAYQAPLNTPGGDAFVATVKSSFSQANQDAIAKIGPTLKPALDALAAKGPVTQEQLMGALVNAGLPNGLAPYVVAPPLAVAAKGGLRIDLPGGLHLVHAGYPNADPTTDSTADQSKMVKAGRSYYQLDGERLDDPSDHALLTGVQQLLTSAADLKGFYKTLMMVLTRTDASGIASLDDASKRAMGQVLTVAFAEADRYVQTGEKQHSWQKDLEDAVFLGAYWAAAGGQMGDFFAKGTSGSGIGETRKARVTLGQALGNAEANLNAEATKALEDAIGLAAGSYDGNILQKLVDYLNTTNKDTRTQIVNNAETISEAAAAYLADMHTNEAALRDAGKVGTTLN